MEKKIKLTISGSAKKSIKNIEIAKTQGKNSVIIEKQTNNFSKKNNQFKSTSKPKFSSQTFSRNSQFKTSLQNKPHSATSDFERRKLAEQRATKRLKSDDENKEKKSKFGNKK